MDGHCDLVAEGVARRCSRASSYVAVALTRLAQRLQPIEHTPLQPRSLVPCWRPLRRRRRRIELCSPPPRHLPIGVELPLLLRLLNFLILTPNVRSRSGRMGCRWQLPLRPPPPRSRQLERAECQGRGPSPRRRPRSKRPKLGSGRLPNSICARGLSQDLRPGSWRRILTRQRPSLRKRPRASWFILERP